MKYLLLLALALLPSLFTAQSKRMSLQIGVSAYPEGSGWGRMHGENDLDLLGPALQGFSFQVEQLRGSAATYGNIREALDRLLRTARPGDWVHLHFSLHGQQIPDDNQDEFDGLDEALVPFDAPASPQDAYTGERHLRDDLLQQHCAALGDAGRLPFGYGNPQQRRVPGRTGPLRSCQARTNGFPYPGCSAAGSRKRSDVADDPVFRDGGP